MHLYTELLVPMRKSLSNLEAWLDKAEAHAQEVGYPPEELLRERLFPNQFALVRQVQAACDTFKLISQRLTDKTAPKHADDEATIGELRERLKSTLAYFDGLSEADFEGSEDKLLPVPFAKEMGARGGDFLRQFSLPNFYFHLTHVYAILRHNGVPIGKHAFIGDMSLEKLPSEG